MRFHVSASQLFGSAPRRFVVFALAPFALDAFLFGVCRALGFEPVAAAFVGKAVLFTALLAGLFGGLAVFMARGVDGPPASWEVVMRVLMAAAFVGLLGYVVGTGGAVVASLASRHDAATVALALHAVFAVGVLAFTRTLARHAFGLRGTATVPAIAVQSAGLVLLGTLAQTAFPAIAAGCIACLILIPLLRLLPQPAGGHS